MSRWVRIVMIVFSFLLACISMLEWIVFISSDAMAAVMAFKLRIARIASWRGITITLCIMVFVASLTCLMLAILSGRLRKARVRNNTLGTVDIGVDAIESIALNAAKTAQAGIKSAKARVAPVRGDKLSVNLKIIAYSDVELPAMMSRVQERVKKDIERYTGIEVAEVHVQVERVDALSGRVER